MTDERMKELMTQVGYPQSHSIAQLILQVENKTAQHWQNKTALECFEIGVEDTQRIMSDEFWRGIRAYQGAIREKFKLEI